MKKQTVILFLLLGLSHTAFAQRVIENPAYEFKSTGINTIISNQIREKVQSSESH